jgi:hypothetical protein
MRIKKYWKYAGITLLIILTAALIYYYVDLVKRTSRVESLEGKKDPTLRQIASGNCRKMTFNTEKEEFAYLESLAKKAGFDRPNAIYTYYSIRLGEDQNCHAIYWPNNSGEIFFIYENKDKQIIKTQVESLPASRPIEDIRMPVINETTVSEN